ncbi:MAG: DUF459 domain-containing protein [Hyphomicrobiales bacterium]|nr:DUF459 domain-containing protein [Hyphomicrobiales bacterium]
MAVISAALLVPAAAQFWNPFSAIQRPPQRAPQQQQPQYNPFGTLFGSPPDPRRTTQPKTDNTHAPPPPRRSPEAAAAITSPILVLGDSMADWLAFGLENAFAERPEFGIVRRHRSYAGLVRYDPRRDVEWPQIVREAIAAEKPKFVVMMVGFHDRQQIRERTPAANPPRSAAPPAPPADDPKSHADPDSPEARARASADAQNAELRKSQRAPPAGSESHTAAPTGPLEFQSEAWQAAYIRRIDATIAALNSANVPVFWVGLPPQRLARQSADAVYLNELYRGRAERAGITYVDIWDGFVDEAGRYVVQGPDFEGQTRRLRSADGLYFTLAGARKLAHYVEREILRSLVSRQTPVALPLPEPTLPQPGRPGATRPLVGAVIPLTASIGGGNELLGGSPSRPTAADPLASRVMVRGEPITAPVGRADNFAWPRGGAATVNEGEVPETQAPVAVTQPTAKPPAPQAAPPIAPPASPPRPPARTAAQPPAGAGAPPASPQYSAPRPKQQAPIQLLPGSEPKQPVQRRAPPPRISNDGVPRPPLSIGR